MVERLDAAGRDRLLAALGLLGWQLDGERQDAARAVYRLLAAGVPVTGSELAEATGWRHARARRFLADLPNAERDDDGRLVGFGGLTLRPTPHRIDLGDGLRHAWCAWDTLFLPVVLDRVGRVISRCPQTRRDITLTVTPGGVTRWDPSATVLSFVRPDADAVADLRGSFCSRISFFADGDAAAAWVDGVSSAFVLDLEDGFELGRRVVEDRYGRRA